MDYETHCEMLGDMQREEMHMPRKMELPFGSVVTVVKHIILKNGWEYYVTDDKFNDDIVRCYVCGLYDELGDVSLSEIKPHIVSQTTKVGYGSDLLPAPNCKWVD